MVPLSAVSLTGPPRPKYCWHLSTVRLFLLFYCDSLLAPTVRPMLMEPSQPSFASGLLNRRIGLECPNAEI